MVIDKKGSIPWIKLFLILGIILVVSGLIYGSNYRYTFCKSATTKFAFANYTNLVANESNKVGNQSGFSKFFCGDLSSGFISGPLSFAKEKLGFNEGLLDFFYPHMFVGLLAGLWIWLAYTFASNVPRFTIKLFKVRDARAGKMSNSWLAFLGSSPWKILGLGVFYAVLMQIPLVNSFVDVITFTFLKSGVWFTIAVRSMILAFYFGLLPGFIEEYTRYRLRKRYYQGVIEAKYRKEGTNRLLGFRS
jgi:hypothetical protein